jgi:hypothetical protein
LLNKEEMNKFLKILNVQFWLFGRDILYDKENLMLTYGFERRRSDGNETSMYVMKLNAHQTLALWGFGFVLMDKRKRNLFVKRIDGSIYFADEFDERGKYHKIDDFGTLRKPKHEKDKFIVRDLIGNFLEWCQVYETWVLKKTGLWWRNECIQASKLIKVDVQQYNLLCQAMKSLLNVQMINYS